MSMADASTESCEITDPGKYSYQRFSYCVTGLVITYILYDTKMAELGRGTIEVSTSATLPKAGTSWNEQVTAKMTSASGQVTALNAKFRPSCSAGCTATKTAPWYKSETTVGGPPLTGFVTYSSTPATGTSTTFLTSYKMYVTAVGTDPIDPSASWDNPREIRCDDAVDTGSAGSSPGCVVPSVMPKVQLSTDGSENGAAVAAYAWAQSVFDDHWGRETPLTRAKDGVADRQSRTCGNASSKPFTPATAVIATDTCAQFPFAETEEGGTDGAQCSEIFLDYDNKDWTVLELGGSGAAPDSSKPCLRAHVAAVSKQLADDQLSGGFQSERVLNGERFELASTVSLDATQADCRRHAPSDPGRVSGNGWIWNTTDPVDHKNISEKGTPSDKTGARAAAAQACLGTRLGAGSEAGGSPVGWEDAKAYARQNNLPESGLSRCHLIANTLGGKISKNLVPCWQMGMNRSPAGSNSVSMWTYESEVLNASKNRITGDEAIFYQVTPRYKNADSTIPEGVIMSAEIQREDGSTQQLFSDIFVPNAQSDGTHSLAN
ncbi:MULTISPECIES: DNA/RNA non-specific endonuclease [Streptomyces]|nr:MULTISPECIES: DNA/RNA non-specific endonuclease [unclassified Streptomyces]